MFKLNILSEIEEQSADNLEKKLEPIKTFHMDESDIFADLEKTLCENIFNFTRNAEALTINQPSEQDLIDCLENVKDLGRLHGPAIRAYNLYKATKAFKEKRYLDSIYYETYAMSLWMRIKFHANNGSRATYANRRPHIIDYIDRFLKYDLGDERNSSNLKSIEFTNGKELMNLCNEFPKEWTVLQLCKQVNLEIFTQTREEALRSPCLIFLTIFCYPMSERFNHQPIKIVLNQKDLKDLYETSRDYSEKLNSNQYFHFHHMKYEQFHSDIISKLKKLLGPWIVLFSGKSRNQRGMSYENKMIARVDQFLSKSKHKYSPYQNVLICLIARRLYMLTREDIKQGALHISNTKDEWFELMDFFYGQENVADVTREEFYPVILVVDEQIDFFFWEMCNPTQEFTRVDSMVTLLKLYFEHQNKISNGYFNVNQRRGSAVLNPDKTLKNMNKHIFPVMSQFKAPTWNVLIEKIPTSTELKTMLANSDIYFYCGHGSGLQFVSSYETCQLYTNAVIFLMGCSTTEFRAHCGYALASADYQYYHLAKSPAIIGNLTLTYTSLCTTFTNVILTKWLCVTNNIELNWFDNEKADQQFAKFLQHELKAIKASKYLTKVIADYKTSHSVPIAFRAILCYRGLPVCLNGN